MSAISSLGDMIRPEQLQHLVLEYLLHNCYTDTARAFKRASSIRQLDADGDELIQDATYEDISDAHNPSKSFESQLRQIELRSEIRTHIMSGRVDDAIALLDRHFPEVLSGNIHPSEEEDPRPTTSNSEYVSSTSTEPAHLTLNLRILAFSEACRTIPLNYPHKTDSSLRENSPDRMVTDEVVELDANGKQMALLERAQKLYEYSITLPNSADRATYSKELENVAGLLAYITPEKSTIAKYLTLERREAVADQISRAILKRTGRPVFSSVEILTRHTQVVWDYAREYNAKPRQGAIMPVRYGSDGFPGNNAIPPFDLHKFLDSKS